MGQNEVIQIESEKDGYVYICNLTTGKWQKVCDISSIKEIPEDIKAQVAAMRQSMEELCHKR